jgi:hypothetical protein
VGFPSLKAAVTAAPCIVVAVSFRLRLPSAAAISFRTVTSFWMTYRYCAAHFPYFSENVHRRINGTGTGPLYKFRCFNKLSYLYFW